MPRKPLMDDHTDEPYAYPCPDCQGGVRRLRLKTYYTRVKDQLITVPNFPAWVCDVCGRSEFDLRAMSWLDTMFSIPERRQPSPPNRRPDSRAY